MASVSEGVSANPVIYPVGAIANHAASSESFHLGYRRWLDGLRGVAILLVMALHLRLVAGGSFGVDIFFVLSGFLITNLLVEEWQRSGSIKLKQFYLRRVLRLVPAFVVLLGAYAIHTVLSSPADEWVARWRELAAVACYVANWPTIHGITIAKLGHTWSLSVEEQFYLLWPALLYFVLRKLPRRQILMLVVAGILASASLRAVLHHQHRFFGSESTDINRLYAGLDTRADALLIGCLEALVATWSLLPTSRRFVNSVTIAALTGTAFIGFCVWHRDLASSQNYDGLFTLVAFSTAVIIRRLLVGPAGIATRILESTPLVGLGRISYGLYLFHFPIIEWIPWEGLGWQYPGTTLLAALLSLAAAVLSYFLIERPFLRLKDRLHSGVKAAPIGAGPASPGGEQARRPAA